MPRLILSFLLLSLVFASGCGSDEPDAAASADALSDAEVRVAEAEARRAEAEARLAEVQAGGVDAPADTPEASSDAASASSSSTAPSGSASVRPGLRGLPPATAGANYTTLVNGARPFTFCQTYSQSAISRYVGMELCYAGTLRQEGTKVVGTGAKDTENGQKLSGSDRTPFQLEGYIYEDQTLRFNFTDKGSRRVSRGSTNFPESGYDGACEGHGWRSATFQTDAANSSGTATFFIEQNCGV